MDSPAPIAGFTEKPIQEFAQELISHGALWNLFILGGSVNALLALFMEEHADTVAEMREALQNSVAGQKTSLHQLYERIPPLDFSRDILELQADRLHVIRVPHCGWTDLGTPKRVEATLRSIGAGVHREPRPRAVPLFFDLESQHP
jgi:mannose-1-phosphate guanylyltransferase